MHEIFIYHFWSVKICRAASACAYNDGTEIPYKMPQHQQSPKKRIAIILLSKQNSVLGVALPFIPESVYTNCISVLRSKRPLSKYHFEDKKFPSAIIQSIHLNASANLFESTSAVQKSWVHIPQMERS